MLGSSTNEEERRRHLRAFQPTPVAPSDSIDNCAWLSARCRCLPALDEAVLLDPLGPQVLDIDIADASQRGEFGVNEGRRRERQAQRVRAAGVDIAREQP